MRRVADAHSFGWCTSATACPRLAPCMQAALRAALGLWLTCLSLKGSKWNVGRMRTVATGAMQALRTLGVPDTGRWAELLGEECTRQCLGAPPLARQASSSGWPAVQPIQACSRRAAAAVPAPLPAAAGAAAAGAGAAAGPLRALTSSPAVSCCRHGAADGGDCAGGGGVWQAALWRARPRLRRLHGRLPESPGCAPPALARPQRWPAGWLLATLGAAHPAAARGSWQARERLLAPRGLAGRPDLLSCLRACVCVRARLGFRSAPPRRGAPNPHLCTCATQGWRLAWWRTASAATPPSRALP